MRHQCPAPVTLQSPSLKATPQVLRDLGMRTNRRLISLFGTLVSYKPYFNEAAPFSFCVFFVCAVYPGLHIHVRRPEVNYRHQSRSRSTRGGGRVSHWKLLFPLGWLTSPRGPLVFDCPALVPHACGRPGLTHLLSASQAELLPSEERTILQVNSTF